MFDLVNCAIPFFYFTKASGPSPCARQPRLCRLRPARTTAAYRCSRTTKAGPPTFRHCNPPQALAHWFTPLLASVYGAILALKALHTYLLLRRPAAAQRWRRAILWTERAARTLLGVRVVAYGESYKLWLERTRKLQAMRVLL